jgi:hypothetical protein
MPAYRTGASCRSCAPCFIAVTPLHRRFKSNLQPFYYGRIRCRVMVRGRALRCWIRS